MSAIATDEHKEAAAKMRKILSMCLGVMLLCAIPMAAFANSLAGTLAVNAEENKMNIALEDIVLTDGVSAADVYAMVLDNSDSTTLQTLLIKQPLNNLNITEKWENTS